MSVHVFVGPTLSEAAVSAIVPDAIMHPPVSHGDLLRIEFESGDVVVIVDGYYHQSASVRHKEILALISAGVRVVGCSSMGALRAAELHRYGMLGNGLVFAMFHSGEVDADDEVAIAHTPAPEYQALSEPLVTIRHVVGTARHAGVVSTADAAAIISVARGINYVTRSWRAVESAVERDHGHLADSFARVLEFRAGLVKELDVKASDAVDTLRRLDELTSASPPGWDDADASSAFLHEWLANFRGVAVQGIQVGDGAVLRFQQVYRTDFPERWRRFALGRVAESQCRSDHRERSLETRALTAAQVQGLIPDSLTESQENEWLTRAERGDEPPEQRLLLLLVRSYRPPSPTYDLTIAEPDIIADLGARQAVAEAMAINEEVASWASAQSVDHLRRESLLDHLAETWDLPPHDVDALRAAARDRGLGSLDKAVEAVRPFYLRAHFSAVGGLASSRRTG